MLYYCPISGKNSERRRNRDSMLRDIFRAEVTKPFQADYADFISDAVSHATKRNSGQFGLDVASTICAINTAALNIHFIQYAPLRNYGGYADIAILQDKVSKAYIVLHGEHLKKYLEGGISGFRLPLQKSPIEEVGDIIAKWAAFSNEIKTRNLHPNAFHRGKIFSEFESHIMPVTQKDSRSTVAKVNRVYGKKIEWVSKMLTK